MTSLSDGRPRCSPPPEVRSSSRSRRTPPPARISTPTPTRSSGRPRPSSPRPWTARARCWSTRYTRGARAFSCGNGGSASIANHMQCDHVKGVRTATDLAPRVQSLSTNVELLSAIANDLGYEHVFTYQLQSQSEPGDVLIAVSSSGRSPNIGRAISWARDHGLHTIAVTGFDGGVARELAEVSIHVECTNYGVIEDLHQSHHARSGPVHPPLADEPGPDLGERVLTVATGNIEVTRASTAASQAAMRVAINLLIGGPGEPVRRPLVLDPGHPGDGPAARGRRGTAPAGQPEVTADAPGVRAGCPLHHLPLVERAAQAAHAVRAPLLAAAAAAQPHRRAQHPDGAAGRTRRGQSSST